MKTIAKLVLWGLLLGAGWGHAAWAGPCDVITQKDARAILGEEVKPGRQSKIVGFAAGLSCRYFTAAPLAKRGGTGSVSLAMYDAATMKQEGGVYTSPQKYFQRTRETLAKRKNAKLQDIPGLGGGAFWQAGGQRLHLLHKGVYYVLSIKDLAKMSSNKGMADLQAKQAARRLELCEDAARKYILK